MTTCSPRTTEAGIVSDTKNDRNTVSCMHVKHTTTQLVHTIYTQSRTSPVTDNGGSQPFLSERNTAFSVIRYTQQTIHVNVLRTTELSTGLSTVGSHAISIFGPSTWNDLPLLSERNNFWTHLNVTSRHFFVQNNMPKLPCSSRRAAVFHRHKSLSKLVVNCVCTRVCRRLCVRVCALNGLFEQEFAL